MAQAHLSYLEQNVQINEELCFFFSFLALICYYHLKKHTCSDWHGLYIFQFDNACCYISNL